MANDILELPGMGGEVGSILGTTVSLFFNIARCYPGLDAIACFEAILDLANLVWEVFQALFPDRPKVGRDSASDDTALFFIPSSNPIIKWWGVGIRELETLGIPTSTSGGPGLTAIVRIADAVLHDLQRQFDGPKAPKLVFAGKPVTGLNVFTWYHQLGFVANNPDSNSVALQERVKVDQLYSNLVARGYIDPQTGFPKSATPPPPPPPPPPPGQPFDPRVSQELLLIQHCICDEMIPQFRRAADELGEMLALDRAQNDFTQPSGTRDIWQALDGIRTTLNVNLDKLASVVGPAEVAGLDRIAAAAERIADEEAKIDPALLAAIQQIENCICVDLPARLESTLEKVTKEKAKDDAALWDVPQDIIDQLIRENAISPELGQLVHGASFAKVRSVAGISDIINTLDKLNRWLGGGPAPGPFDPVHLTDNLEKRAVELFSKWLVLSEKTFGRAGVDILGVIDKHFDGVGIVEPGAQRSPAQVALGDAFGLGTSAHLAAVIAEAVYPTKNLGLPQLAALMAELGGFAEIARTWHGPRLNHAIRLPADYEAAEKHRSTKPAAQIAAQMFSRRIISAARSRQYMAWAGYEDSIIDELEANAYRPIQPRVWIQAADDTPIDHAGIRESMRYGGQREQDIDTFIKAAELQSIKSLRHKYLDAAIAAAEKGTIPVSKLTDVFHDLTIDDEARNLILDHLEITRLGRLGAEYKQAWEIKARAGVISPAEYRVALEHIPLTDTEITVQVAILEAHLAADQAKETERELRKVTDELRAEEVRAAMARYHAGEVNSTGLTASLIAAGLTPALAAAFLSLATVREQETKATTQKLEIRAVEAEYKKNLITRTVLIASLERAGMTAHDAGQVALYLDAVKAKKA